MKFQFQFKTPLIIEADSIDQAYDMVDSGEVIQYGFKQTTKRNEDGELEREDVYFDELPDYELTPIDEPD